MIPVLIMTLVFMTILFLFALLPDKHQNIAEDADIKKPFDSAIRPGTGSHLALVPKTSTSESGSTNDLYPQYGAKH